VTYRLRSILKDGRLSRQGIGEQKISLTTERSVAEYWACVSTSADRSPRNRIPQGQDAVPAILVLDGEKLLALGYKLVPFSDTYHGQGNAIGKTRSRVGTGILSTWTRCSSRWEPVPPERFQVFLKRGRVAFKPVIPPIGHFELSVMKGTIKRLAKGKIRPADADLVVGALAALCSALRLTGEQATSSAT
jgi:hypothetical protein